MQVRRRGGRAISDKLDRMWRGLGVNSLLEARLLSIGRIVLGQIQVNMSNKILHKRSGDLYDSWNFRVTAEKFGYQLAVGSYSVYARIHDLGGWAGRNHASRIPARRYASKAFETKKRAIDRHMKEYIYNLVK